MMNINKYHKWYDQLIDRARNRTIEGYVERHHIVPKSLGGTNEISNLVALTAREHLIAHMLLPRFVENKAPMWNAVWMMMNTQGRKLTGRLYEQARIEYRGICKSRSIGIKKSPETLAKMSAAKKGRKKSPEHIAKMSATRKGKKHSPETLAKMSAARKGIKKSPETLAKMSATRKGKKHSSETRDKMRAAQTGKKLSSETRARMSAARKGRKGKKLSPETITKRQATRAANRALKPLQLGTY